MPGSSSWMPYAPQGVKGLDDDEMQSKSYNPISIKISVLKAQFCVGLANDLIPPELPIEVFINFPPI